MVTPSFENWQYPLKLKRHVRCDSAVSLQGINPRAMNAFGHQKMHVRMFVAGLFSIAKTKGNTARVHE